jgi:hypothetical protein
VGVFEKECSMLVCRDLVLEVVLPSGRRRVVCLLLCRQVESNVVCCQTTAIDRAHTQDSLGVDARQHSITLGL